jgi:hypothetical protein
MSRVWAAMSLEGALSPRKGTSVIVYRAGIALVACLATLLFGSANARAVVSAAGPVAVLQCSIHRRMGYVAPFHSATITFVNRGDVSLDEVRFTLNYAGRTTTLVDRGTFAKGVTIEHAFSAFWNVPYAGATPQRCVVDSVHYARSSSS